MDSAREVMRRSAGLRWRQGAINILLAVIFAWLLGAWEPNFLVLGLFPFGLLRIVQGVELRMGLVRGGWTDIPMTPPVIGCWAAAAIFLQQLVGRGQGRSAVPLALWVLAGILLYAVGRWLQMRYYARYLRREQ